jgi:crotonobetainyl-CoA:carnitine CoA-transferase CaiB-like acyl-CoA transferase
MLAVMTDRQFAALMRALDRADTLDDPRFADWSTRSANEPALREIIETALAGADAKTWEARLTAANVPCAGIWSIDEIVHHPQLEHRDVLQRVAGVEGEMTLVGSGFRLAEGGSGSIERAPARLGEHSEAILAEAGYSDREIAELRGAAVI